MVELHKQSNVSECDDIAHAPCAAESPMVGTIGLAETGSNSFVTARANRMRTEFDDSDDESPIVETASAWKVS